MLINPNSAQRKGKMAQALPDRRAPLLWFLQVADGWGACFHFSFVHSWCTVEGPCCCTSASSQRFQSRVWMASSLFRIVLELCTRCHTAHARMRICSGPPLTRSALDSFGRSGRAPNSLSKTFFFLRTVSVKRSRFQYVTGLALPRCICGLIGCTVHNPSRSI